MGHLAIYCSLLWIISFFEMQNVSSKRILMLPFLNSSHAIILHAVASRLAVRGHSVTVLWTTEFSHRVITRYPNYTLIEFSTGITPDKLTENIRTVQENFANPNNVSMPTESMGWLKRLNNYIELFRSMSRFGESISTLANAVCRVILSDNNLLDRLKAQQFDIALVDDNFLARCIYLIPHTLGKYAFLRLSYLQKLKT